MKSKDLNKQTKSIFLKVFSELPYKVLWKFEDASISTDSKIMIKGWLPQQQILSLVVLQNKIKLNPQF